MAVSDCLRVSHDLRKINSALIFLKKVSTAALSWQSALPLIDAFRPCSRRIFW